MRKSNDGSALMGIIIIVIILIVGGVFFLNMMKQATEKARVSPENVVTQTTTIDATPGVAPADVFTSDDAGEQTVVNKNAEVNSLDITLDASNMGELTK